MQYPQGAIERGVEGRVVVRFMVNADCAIDSVSVVRGIDPELDAEAIRLVKSLSKFASCGKMIGKPVNVWYTLPVKFKLSGDVNEELR